MDRDRFTITGPKIHNQLAMPCIKSVITSTIESTIESAIARP
jgi:hypothetical protein